MGDGDAIRVSKAPGKRREAAERSRDLGNLAHRRLGQLVAARLQNSGQPGGGARHRGEPAGIPLLSGRRARNTCSIP